MNERAIYALEFDKILKMLMSKAVSDMGRERIRSLYPQSDSDLVLKWLKETQHAVDLHRELGPPPLSGMHDISFSLQKSSVGSTLSQGELLKISAHLRTCRQLKSYVDKAAFSNENRIKKVIYALYSNPSLENNIERIIKSEDEVYDHASQTLFRIRRKIVTLKSKINDRLQSILRSEQTRTYIQDQVVTIRNDRFVIPIKQANKSDFPGIVHDSSASGATVFVEPSEVVDMNNQIQEELAHEQAELEIILKNLTAKVGEVGELLTLSLDKLGLVDFVFAKAKLAGQLRAICPEVTSEKSMNIVEGRHPLLNDADVVPINLWIGKDFQTLIMTGPNTGGKTVTLKTMGLFSLMAQSGLHLPAKLGTKVTIFKKIFADIGDEQSIEQSLSTFSAHMKNVIQILSDVDDRSLVLLDELGSGTDPTEGAALAISILENLIEKKTITICSTHYSEIKLYALATESVQNASCEFDLDTLSPTYRVSIGVPGKSNAFEIAKRLGLDEALIRDARTLIDNERIKFEDVIAQITNNMLKTQHDMDQVNALKKENEKLRQGLEIEKKRFESQKDQLIRKAREEADLKIEEVSETISEILEKVKQEEKLGNLQAIREHKTALLEKKHRPPKNSTQSVFSNSDSVRKFNIYKGDEVTIVSLNQKATVLSAPDKNDEMWVQAGIMKVKIPRSNLKKENTTSEIQKQGRIFLGGKKKEHIKQEIDLRGQTVHEALSILDKYLDDVILCGLPKISIIHGKGTGSLRKGIHEYLQQHSTFNRFRIGSLGEGDTGVTVVDIT